MRAPGLAALDYHTLCPNTWPITYATATALVHISRPILNHAPRYLFFCTGREATTTTHSHCNQILDSDNTLRTHIQFSATTRLGRDYRPLHPDPTPKKQNIVPFQRLPPIIPPRLEAPFEPSCSLLLHVDPRLSSSRWMPLQLEVASSRPSTPTPTIARGPSCS